MQLPRLEFRYTAMKVLWLFVLTIITGQAFAQGVTFKKRFDNGLDNLGLNVAEVDSHYILVGRGYSELEPYHYVKLFKTDLNGYVVDYKEYGENGTFWDPGRAGSLSATSDGNFAIGGTKDIGGNYYGLLIKFNRYLDTLWTKVYPSTSYLTFYQCRETLDKGFVLIGASTENDPNANFLLIKTDSLGNELWRKEYGGIYRDIGRNIEITSDGGFILSGDRFQDASMNSRVGYLVKTDSAGNIEWDKYFGTSGNDGLFFVNTVNEVGYLIWGNIDTLGSSLPVAYLSKIDSSGNVIWRTVFTQFKSAFILQSRQLSDNTILSAGEVRHDSLFGPIAWFVLHDENGNRLWERFYYWNRDSMLGMAINDFIETSDGAILATGFAYKTESNGISRTQFLLMKLDSNGCLINDCGLFTGIKEYFPPNNATVSVYPNPASNYLTISYTSNHNLAVKPKAIIYNLQGQVLQEVVLQSNSGQEQISVAGYPSGMYLYQVVSGGQVLGSGKLVVE